MAIQGVDTKCYILALFVRDDGERFLLGSGHYEFKDTQMHFAANAIQNDIVEVQGNDGFLLAGQVRRPGTQSFDGYVGDGTMSKEETESYRRQFFSFFRKNFFYKVIYVFSDGTAIQRKSGFLVDDPTVEELYQMYPEYHVALNFEDVNYYSYSEDEEGQEQYAKEATIDTSSMRATGGLVWDNLGVVWEATQWGGEQTASGTEMTVQNEMNVPSRVDDIRLDGDTEQQTYSGKNLVDFANASPTVVNNGSGVNNNGVYTVNANTTDRWGGVRIIAQVEGNTTYTFSATVASTTAASGSILFIPRLSSATGQQIESNKAKSGERAVVTFTTPSDLTDADIRFLPFEANATAIYTDIMLEKSSTATSYEPYTGGVPAPNPDYPQAVQTATGEQTVTISNGSVSQNFTVDLGSLELCKIGTYQDYIYKGTDGWYLHKEVDSVDLYEKRVTSTAFSDLQFYYMTGYDALDVMCTHFTGIVDDRITANGTAYTYMNDGQCAFRGGTSKDRVYFKTSKFASSADMTTWLASNHMLLYYIIATPTDTKITDDTLVAQLNALGTMKLFIGENNLITQSTGTNLPAPLSFKYYTTVAMTGAEWEEGGSGGATVVEVDSITNTYPIWRVKGPAVDPQLSVINTNTTIRYTGTVTSTQTLEIDMFNKTAKLNGVSVIGNVSGDWVSLAPGTNRVIYTAENADAQPSTIEWQEVVG